MRRILTLGLAVVALVRGGAAQTVTARIGGELTGFAGGTVTVPVTLDLGTSGERLGSYTARLHWDPAVLNLSCFVGEGGTVCDLMSGNFPLPQINVDSAALGVLRFTAVSPAGVGGLVTLAQLRFSIVAGQSSALTLSFSELSAAGTYTNLLPNLVTSGATFCPAIGRWGDVDGDTLSNSRDALLTLTSVVGLPLDPALYNIALADVDADGAITSRDALVILSYAVGIAIPGQRVLLLAPGTCGTGSAKTIAVFPSAADVVANQKLPLLLQARDSAGRAVTLTGATWTSSDFGIAGVDTSGMVTPRAPGVVTVTGEAGPGVRASATITVLARRPNWYADAKKTGAALQLGSAAYPFASPVQAFPLVTEGDTVRVASGTYDFVASGSFGQFFSGGQLAAGAVILGGTPGDTTTRPVLRDATGGLATGLLLLGGKRTVVENVALQGFHEGVALEGVRSFALQDSRITAGPYSGYGIYQCASGNSMDSVRVENSALLGDSASRGGTGIQYAYCSVVGLTVLKNATIRYWGDGLDLADADSTDVSRSVISDNDGYGIYLESEYGTTPGLHVTHSRLENNAYDAVNSTYARRAVLDTTVITSGYYQALDITGYDTPAEIYLRGDTFNLSSRTVWVYGCSECGGIDTLVLDRSLLQWPADTANSVYTSAAAKYASVTRSTFRNVGSGAAAELYANRIVVDSVQMTACAVAGCDRGYGFDLESNGGALNLTIDYARFFAVGYPIYAYGAGFQQVTHTHIDSAATGMELYGDSLVVTDDSLGRITDEGLEVYESNAPGLVHVARDTVSCSSASGAYGVDIEDHRAVAESSLVASCAVGIYGSSLVDGSLFRGNTIRTLGTGFELYGQDALGSIAVDSNGVSGDTVGVKFAQGKLFMAGNNIANNTQYGLWVTAAQGALHQVHANSFTGNGLAAYSTTDSVNAEYNWWGQPAGACSPGADCVSGRIDTTLALGSAPAPLPGLAPPVTLLASRVSSLTLAPAPAASRSAVRVWHRTAPVLDLPVAHLSPAQVAQLERSRQRQAAHAAARAAREQQLAAERARLAAEATARHAARRHR